MWSWSSGSPHCRQLKVVNESYQLAQRAVGSKLLHNLVIWIRCVLYRPTALSIGIPIDGIDACISPLEPLTYVCKIWREGKCLADLLLCFGRNDLASNVQLDPIQRELCWDDGPLFRMYTLVASGLGISIDIQLSLEG